MSLLNMVGQQRLLSMMFILGFTATKLANAEELCYAGEVATFNCELEESIASLCQSNDGMLIYRNGIE